MNEQPRSAVSFVDGKAHYELAAEEVVFRIETANPLKPIYFHMRPYSFEEIQTALKALKPKIRDVGKTIISEDGDVHALLPLFDQTFIRMSNVRLSATDVEPPSVEQQKAWLDRNPRLKARVINEGFCMVFLVRNAAGEELTPGVEVNGAAVDQPVVLEDLLAMDDAGAEVAFFYRLQSEESGKREDVAIRHHFDVETLRDYNQYDHASRREIDKSSGFTSIDVDHQTIARLYDRTVLRLEGCLIDGEACTEANRKVWAPRVPYYFKKIALDARFEDITKKNS